MTDMDVCQTSSNDLRDKSMEAIINEATATLMTPSAITIDPKRRHHNHHGKHHQVNGQAISSSLEASDKQPNSVVLHGPRSWKNSRRSRNGYGRGLPKKGGAGGKGVWGRPGMEDLLMEDSDQIDPADPNYDPSDLETSTVILKPISPKHNLSEAEIKALVTPHLLEYYETGDTEEALRCLEDSLIQIGTDERHLLVRYAIELAMDHKASHRELTSVLLAELMMGHLVLRKDLEKAFKILLDNLNDLVLDLPEAAIVLGNFFARAVADECIAPRWVIEELKIVRTKMTHLKNFDETANLTYNDVMAMDTAEADVTGDEPISSVHNMVTLLPKTSLSPTQITHQCLNRAQTLLSLDHGMVRLHAVWGVGGALRPVQFLRRQMSLLLREFLSSTDMAEAARCLKALEVPHFHHEVVYEAIVMALEANRAIVEEQMATLLWTLHDQGLISPEQTERGFLRVFADLKDISMDVPLAYILLDRFVERVQQRKGSDGGSGKEEGKLLGEAVLAKLPTRGRKRFVSEGDHHVRRAAAVGKGGYLQMM